MPTYYVQQGITFGVTDVLMYELLRKPNDDRRKRSLFKLSDAHGLVLLPGVGEMFRVESKYRKPALSVLRARRLELTPGSDSSSEPFPLTASEMRASVPCSDVFAPKYSYNFPPFSNAVRGKKLHVARDALETLGKL